MRSILNNNLFNINFISSFILIFFLIALFYGPLLVNSYYIILFIIFTYKIYVKEIDFKIELNLSLILQIIFCTYLVLNSFFLNNDLSLTYKSLFYFRFFFSVYMISKILNINDDTLSFISLIFLLCSLLLSIDILYQSQNGIDFFGFEASLCRYPNGSNEIDPNLCERFSGFFGKELIAGNFLSTYGLFFLYLFFYNVKKTFLNKCIIFFSFILILTSIIISGERNSFLSVLIILFLNFLFNKKLRKYIFLLILLFSFILTLAIKNFPHIQHRYIDWPISNISSHKGNLLKKLMQTPWGNHYLIAYEIFNENKIFGSGYKSFRIECKKPKYSFESLNKKYDLELTYSGCSTHPHSMYLEILLEIGIFGFLILLITFYFLIVHPYFKRIKYIKEKETVIFTLSILIAILFPFRPTGSFTATIFATNIWFFVGFYLYFINKSNHKINKLNPK